MDDAWFTPNPHNADLLKQLKYVPGGGMWTISALGLRNLKVRSLTEAACDNSAECQLGRKFMPLTTEQRCVFTVKQKRSLGVCNGQLTWDLLKEILPQRAIPKGISTESIELPRTATKRGVSSSQFVSRSWNLGCASE